MTKTTVYLDQETALAVRQLASLEGRSQAEIIREAVSAYARKAERPLPRGAGKYRSGRTDLSERAEEILREAGRPRRWR